MNIKQIITLFLGLILTFQAVIIGFYFSNRRSNADYEREKMLYLRQSDTLAFIKSNYVVNTEITGSLLPEEMIAYGEDSISIRTFTKGKNLLIYRYADIHCHTCIESDIEVMQTVFTGSLDKILILCSYDREQDYISFKRLNRIQIPMLRLPRHSFNWGPEDMREQPYFFMLNANGRISNVFIPEQKYYDLTEKYLIGIRGLIE